MEAEESKIVPEADAGDLCSQPLAHSGQRVGGRIEGDGVRLVVVGAVRPRHACAAARRLTIPQGDARQPSFSAPG